MSKGVFPADWEPHAAVWLAWPATDTITAGLSARDAHANVVRALLPFVRVALLVNDDASERPDVLARIGPVPSGGCSIEFHAVPHSDVWMRDFGPIFVVKNAVARKNLGVFSFRWTAWGYELNHSDSAALLVDAHVAESVAKLRSLPLEVFSFASEGGDRSFNGRGTLIASRVVEQQRNPGMPLESIERALLDAFSLQKIIWVGAGIPDDAHTFECPVPPSAKEEGVFINFATGGHVDEFVRFCGPSTVLLAEVMPSERDTPLGKLAHSNLEAVFQEILASTDESGNAIAVIRVPLPPLITTTVNPSTNPELYSAFRQLRFQQPLASRIVDAGEPLRLAASASYLNYLVTNGGVLVPFYFRPGRSSSFLEADGLAVAALHRAFPGRQVVQVDFEALNYLGGGMNCISQQEPSV